MLGAPAASENIIGTRENLYSFSCPPKIRVSGDHSIRLGHVETIKIATESEVNRETWQTIDASIQTPAGKRDQLRLSHVSVGRYNAAYAPGKPGNYNAHIVRNEQDAPDFQGGLLV